MCLAVPAQVVAMGGELNATDDRVVHSILVEDALPLQGRYYGIIAKDLRHATPESNDTCTFVDELLR